MERYLELMVLLHFLVDFLLILGTNRLSGFPAAPMRSALGALLGALCSGLCLVPGFCFLGTPLWKGISLVGAAVLAFGWDRSARKRGGLYLLLHLAMGGAAQGFGREDFPALILAAILIWLLCCIGFNAGDGTGESVPVTITFGRESASFLALRDTGNTLRDPVTGQRVLVVSDRIGTRLTGLSQAQLRNPLETLLHHPVPGLRLIPYRAVGCGSAMMLGMRFDNVKIGSRRQSVVVAFAPEGLGREEGYQALAGGV